MTTLRSLAAAALVVAARPGGAAPFAPGEETVMQFRYLNVPSGEGRITVGQPEGPVWPVIIQARTDGVAGFIDIREHLVSYWDKDARLPRGVDLRAYEVGDYHTEITRFDRVNGKATHEKQRKGNRSVKTFDVPADVRDLTSAFMWLRHQPLRPGDRHDLPVCSGDRQFTLVAEVLDGETVETRAGTFRTVKVKVRTAFEGKFSTKRDTFLWVSDDSRHLLVKMSADFAVGSLVGTLKSYRAGTQIAAR
jgi:hypothetical protein